MPATPARPRAFRVSQRTRTAIFTHSIQSISNLQTSPYPETLLRSTVARYIVPCYQRCMTNLLYFLVAVEAGLIGFKLYSGLLSVVRA